MDAPAKKRKYTGSKARYAYSTARVHAMKGQALSTGDLHKNARDGASRISAVY